MPTKNVPFYGNTPDDTHCYQAALRMVAKYFWPNEEYSWSELEKITAKVEGLWTWPTAGLLWLSEKGAQIQVVELFSLKEFAEKREQYLLDFCGQEVGQEQIKHSDINQEIVLAQKAIKKITTIPQIPTIEELLKVLDQGYLVICNVNSKALNNQPGYVGHFVVIIGHDQTHFEIHDPGLPPQPNRKVTFEQFEKAWAYPEAKNKNYTAIKT